MEISVINKFMGYRGIGFLFFWVPATACTAKALRELGVPAEDYINLYAGIIVQIGLSLAQHLLWERQVTETLGKLVLFSVVGIDVLFNFGGVYGYTKNIGQAEFYTNLFQTAPNNYLLLGIGFLVAIVLATLPELFIKD